MASIERRVNPEGAVSYQVRVAAAVLVALGALIGARCVMKPKSKDD